MVKKTFNLTARDAGRFAKMCGAVSAAEARALRLLAVNQSLNETADHLTEGSVVDLKRLLARLATRSPRLDSLKSDKASRSFRIQHPDNNRMFFRVLDYLDGGAA